VSAFGLSLSHFFDYQKGSQSLRDTLKADLISSLQKKGAFLALIQAFDEWKSQSVV
jgi:hypothetical protein